MKKYSGVAWILCFAILLSFLPGMALTADALTTWGEIPADVDKLLDDYIAENFYEGMPDEEKMDALARFSSQYAYSNESSSYVTMIQTGSGNCGASTGAILELCRRLGLEAYARDAEIQSGIWHVNALVVAGEGDYYVLDAGYPGKAPRYYSISRQTTLFSYSIHSASDKLLTVTQYDGNLTDGGRLSVPETIAVYDRTGKLVPYTVTCIGKDFYDPTTFILPGYLRPQRGELQEVVLPKSIEKIESSAFGNCKKLSKIVFSGDAPTISADAFYGVTATVYYPVDADGWTAKARQNYGGTLTWQPYCTEGHIGSQGTVLEEGNCLEDGLMSYLCKVCGMRYTEVIPSSGKHSYSGEDFRFDAATGTHCQVCSLCGMEVTETCTFGASTVKKEASVYRLGVKEYRCTVCGGTCEASYPYRVFGENRYKTGMAAADTLKEILGVNEFETIIVACGTDFADALAGSYLANQKNAPILLVNKHSMTEVKNYISENLSEDGTLYLLGGEAAISSDMEKALGSFRIKRLAGANRYETNLKILEETGTFGREVLICTGKGFADSLSASAVNRPILLVNQKLNDDQKEFLESSSGKFIIIGGESAVNAKIEAELEDYGSVERVGGQNRYETSVMVAERFFENPKTAVLAYAKKFPDGLCGGPLAYSLNAPLILTATGKEADASSYVEKTGITNGVVLGGTGLISDLSAAIIFPLREENLSDEEYFAQFEPVLRFAVASDIHVDDSGTELQEVRLAKLFESAYAYAKTQRYDKLDGAFFAGDFANRGTQVSMEKFFEIVETSAHVETVTRATLGNHEFYTDSENTISRFLSASGYEQTDCHMVLNGYHFLFVSPDLNGLHFSAQTQRWLATELAAAAADDPSGTKPIFVFQHEHIYDTVYGSLDWGMSDLTAILEKYPQVIDFSGHSHYPISDPRSVWQGSFTALGTGTLSYYEMDLAGVQSYGIFHSDYEGGYSTGASIFDAAEYYIVEVDANHAVRIQGYDLGTDKLMENPILLRSVGNPEAFCYTEARKEASEAPVFGPETKVTADVVTDSSVKISFTQAKCQDTVQHYRVELYQDGQKADSQLRLACWFCDEIPEKLTAEFSGLYPETEYTVKIIAVSPWEKESIPYQFAFQTETEEDSSDVYEETEESFPEVP